MVDSATGCGLGSEVGRVGDKQWFHLSDGAVDLRQGSNKRSGHYLILESAAVEVSAASHPRCTD